MRLNGRIITYSEIETQFNPSIKKTEVVRKDKIGEYSCRIDVIEDYVETVSVGRKTGRTLRVILFESIPKFKYAEVEGKYYKSTSYRRVRNRFIMTLEEVSI